MPAELVSVVIPTFNRAGTVERAIDSVLAQTHSPVEIILVDDGSTDDTSSAIRSRYGSDSRLRYVFQENQGVTAARNTGLGLVTGEYVAFLDSDDTWKPWKLQVQVRCLQSFPELGMVWTDMEALDENGRVTHPAYLRTMYHAYQRFEEAELFSCSVPLTTICPEVGQIAKARLRFGTLYPQILMGNLVHTSTVLLSRKRFEAVKTFNPELKPSGEDYDFHLRTCREGAVGLIDIPSIQYQTGRSDQLTHPKYRLVVATNTLKTVLPHLESRQPTGLSRRMIRQRLAHLHGWIGEALFDSGRNTEAAGHLFASLRNDPLQPRIAKFLLASMLPASSSRKLRKMYSNLRGTKTAI